MCEDLITRFVLGLLNSYPYELQVRSTTERAWSGFFRTMPFPKQKTLSQQDSLLEGDFSNHSQCHLVIYRGYHWSHKNLCLSPQR